MSTFFEQSDYRRAKLLASNSTKKEREKDVALVFVWAIQSSMSVRTVGAVGKAGVTFEICHKIGRGSHSAQKALTCSDVSHHHEKTGATWHQRQFGFGAFCRRQGHKDTKAYVVHYLVYSKEYVTRARPTSLYNPQHLPCGLPVALVSPHIFGNI